MRQFPHRRGAAHTVPARVPVHSMEDVPLPGERRRRHVAAVGREGRNPPHVLSEGDEGVIMTTELAPNWQALLDECIHHLQALIQLDTSNPPGNEIIAAHYIAAQSEEEGIACEIVESAPGRANLRAVLKGDGSERPLLLMSHTDVVPVEPKYWSREPFSGEIAD